MQDTDADANSGVEAIEKKPKKGFFDKVASGVGGGYNIAKGVGSAMVGGSAPPVPYESELAVKMQEYMVFSQIILQASDGLSGVDADLYEKLRGLLTAFLSNGHVAEDIKETCMGIQQHAERVSAAPAAPCCGPLVVRAIVGMMPGLLPAIMRGTTSILFVAC